MVLLTRRMPEIPVQLRVGPLTNTGACHRRRCTGILALRKVFSSTREQRCWVHKTANILNDIPKATQPRVKKSLHEIWEADTKEDAERALDHFKEKYEAKYPKAWERLEKDRDVLLSFYNFPAEQWRHIRTTNPIESAFATIRLRHRH